MQNIDDIIKYKVKQEIDLPNNYKETVKNTVQKCTQNQKDYTKKIRKYKILNFLRKIGISALVGASTITVYSATTNNLPFINMGLMKVGENFEENSIEVNKSIENEYVKIILESLAGDNAYIILEYRINLKEKAISEFGNVKYSDAMGYSLWISDNILVNSNEITNKIQEISKISDTEFVYVEVLNIMDIAEENLKLEINMNNLIINSDMTNKITLNKSLQFDVKINTKDKTEFIQQERILDEKNKIVINNVGNTQFATYITLQKITENMTYKEFKELNPWKYNSFIVTDENGEEISFSIHYAVSAGEYYYVKNENGEFELTDLKDLKDIEDNDQIRYIENFVILLGAQEKLDNIKIIPIETTMFNDKNNEEADEYKKVKWYPLVEGQNKYSATSSLGGTLEINNIKIDENYITFYYNKKGLIGNDSLIILRKNNGTMNYIYPLREEINGINSTENKVVFSRNLFGIAGLNVYSLEDLDKNLENVEFALLYGSKSKIIAEEFKIQIPKQDNQTAEIDNIKIMDLN